MNEQQLKDRLADLVADQPPMRHGSPDDLRVGRRRLRRRRGAALAGTGTLAAVGVALAVTTPWQGGTGVRFEPGPAAGPEPSVVERCTQVDNGALDAARFGAGSRVLTSQTSPSGEVAAVVVSADGTAWGSCLLFADKGAEFDGTAAAYPMATGRPGAGQQETSGMGFGRGHFWYVDRFPADVATVSVRLDADHTVRADAVDGFVAFAVDGTWLDMDAQVDGAVTLRAADGTVLSAPSMTRGDASVLPAYRTLVPEEPLPDGGAAR